MANLLFLELEGDARERGLTQGKATAPMIRNNLETYFARFAASGSSRDEVLAEAEAWSEVIAGCAPEYREEMSAIAEGAELSLTELAVLNARYEITYCLYAKDARAAASTIEQPLQEGCSLFGLLPDATASGSCIVGQNWDWLEGLRGNVFVKRVRRGDGKPDFVGFTEAGIVGAKMGVNSAGIGAVPGWPIDSPRRTGRTPHAHPCSLRANSGRRAFQRSAAAGACRRPHLLGEFHDRPRRWRDRQHRGDQ